MHQNKNSARMRGKMVFAAGLLLLASAFAAGPAAAQAKKGGSSWKSHLSTDAPDVLYRHHCAVCHGENGDGNSLAKHALDPVPRDFTSEKARTELSRAHMIEVLNKGTVTKDGKPTSMIAWKGHLSPEQIETLVDFIIVKFMDGKPAVTEDAHDHRHKGHDHGNVKAVDYPYGLKPNVTQGKSVYAANCAACHGEQGDGRGNPARMAGSKPRNFQSPDFIEFANGFSLFSAVSKGRGHMPAWDKKLSNQEIADVSEYVLQTYVKPAQGHAEGHKH
ncbi:MAG TPA: c-type cytochrome [Noviherbaspirillum sp.]